MPADPAVSVVPPSPQTVREQLDAHVRDMVAWHFSPDTGAPYWLDWARHAGRDPVREVRSFDDLLTVFEPFDDEALRREPHAAWIPRAYQGRPYCVFETGGTTGQPKQRLSWEDHLTDYTEFSNGLSEAGFPHGGAWLMLGPTGPRRLRLAIEHLAQHRGGSCFFVDLDPRWVKRLLADGEHVQARRYMDHVIDQAMQVLRHRDIACLFTTPRLLEALGERASPVAMGVRGVFCGGTSMTPQVIRFLVEEVLENKAELVPTYGNTLMGLARGRPVNADVGYELTYHAPQPRAVLRVVDRDDPAREVDYGQWGRVELTTLTREFFMPRLLERDEAIRREPWGPFGSDGVGDVRPLGWETRKTVEGVY